MKTIGLLGGMSWESTQHYYQLLNEGIKQQLGGLHSAKVAMVSVDFAPIAELAAPRRLAAAWSHFDKRCAASTSGWCRRVSHLH